MIICQDDIFGLHYGDYSMLLRRSPQGLLELLHFGEAVETADWEAFLYRPGLGWGSSILLDAKHTESCRAYRRPPEGLPSVESGAGQSVELPA